MSTYLANGCDKEGWAVYKALSGAYKYAMTQTFAIPTIDDAEKDKYITNSSETNTDIELDNDANITQDGGLNEKNIEEILGSPDINDFGEIFNLEKTG